MQQWVVGIVYWAVSHSLCVWAAKRDPKFTEVLTRHIRPQGISVMLNLSEYRNRPRGLVDYLPWAAMVAPGIVLNRMDRFNELVVIEAPIWKARRLNSWWPTLRESTMRFGDLVPDGHSSLKLRADHR